jgi:hypothetical protein
VLPERVYSDRGHGERRGPRLGRGASAASDPAVNVAVLRFRERAKYSSLEGDHRRRHR